MLKVLDVHLQRVQYVSTSASLCSQEVIGASVVGPSGLTFGSVDHLSMYCSGDDGLGKILQVPAQTVAQDGEFHRIQVW